jgi:hypothetical protein
VADEKGSGSAGERSEYQTLQAQQVSIVDAFLDIVVMKQTKMREYLNSICKPKNVRGKCLTDTSGIPPRTLLCVRIGNKQRYQRFGVVRSRCYTAHKDFKKVEDFPTTMPMLLELDTSTTRQDIAEMVPLWMLRDMGVCKVEFNMILRRPLNEPSDIISHHFISLFAIRTTHYHQSALTAKSNAEEETQKALKAKNKATLKHIKELAQQAHDVPRKRTKEELQIKAMTKEELGAQVSKSGDDAFADFQSKYNVGQMVVVRNGIFRLCLLFSREVAESHNNTHV